MIGNTELEARRQAADHPGGAGALPGTEAKYRQESQTLLCGVATLADAQTLEQVLDSLIQVLKPFIGFEHADVVAWEGEGITHLSTQDGEVGRSWQLTRSSRAPSRERPLSSMIRPSCPNWRRWPMLRAGPA